MHELDGNIKKWSLKSRHFFNWLSLSNGYNTLNFILIKNIMVTKKAVEPKATKEKVVKEKAVKEPKDAVSKAKDAVSKANESLKAPKVEIDTEEAVEHIKRRRLGNGWNNEEVE